MSIGPRRRSAIEVPSGGATSSVPASSSPMTPPPSPPSSANVGAGSRPPTSRLSPCTSAPPCGLTAATPASTSPQMPPRSTPVLAGPDLLLIVILLIPLSSSLETPKHSVNTDPVRVPEVASVEPVQTESFHTPDGGHTMGDSRQAHPVEYHLAKSACCGQDLEGGNDADTSVGRRDGGGSSCRSCALGSDPRRGAARLRRGGWAGPGSVGRPEHASLHGLRPRLDRPGCRHASGRRFRASPRVTRGQLDAIA